MRGTSISCAFLLCNGYRSELEPESPLDAALESRRTDLVYLPLDWGVDPHGADPGRILDTYRREVFERFWEAGVDLTARGAMADAFANSTRNLPLYGFAKNYRVRDLQIERALAEEEAARPTSRAACST